MKFRSEIKKNPLCIWRFNPEYFNLMRRPLSSRAAFRGVNHRAYVTVTSLFSDLPLNKRRTFSNYVSRPWRQTYDVKATVGREGGGINKSIKLVPFPVRLPVSLIYKEMSLGHRHHLYLENICRLRKWKIALFSTQTNEDANANANFAIRVVFSKYKNFVFTKLLSISLLSLPCVSIFHWNSVDSSVFSWTKRWRLVLEMSVTFWRQRGNEAVKVSFESRTAQVSALYFTYSRAILICLV